MSVCLCWLKRDVYSLLSDLERKLNESLQSLDVSHVPGSLHGMEKYWFIQIFCAKINLPQLRTPILLATVAAIVAIDNPSANCVNLVQNIMWTHNLCTAYKLVLCL